MEIPGVGNEQDDDSPGVGDEMMPQEWVMNKMMV